MQVGSSANRRALLAFPQLFDSPAGIPLGALVVEAKLRLNVHSVSGLSAIKICPITDPRRRGIWNESTTTVNLRSESNTWESRGGDFDEALCKTVSLTGSGFYEIDVNSHLQGWSSGDVNQGWILIAAGSRRGNVWFKSREYRGVSVHPRLSVTYYVGRMGTPRLPDGDSRCADTGLDTDGDLVTDCEDLCPLNKHAIEPGSCGCEAVQIGHRCTSLKRYERRLRKSAGK